MAVVIHLQGGRNVAVWKKDFTLQQLSGTVAGTMTGHIGIEFVGFGDDWLEARMPVDQRTIQYMGIMHGGAAAALAETVGSYAANLALETGRAVGLELNINHLRAVRSGYVLCRATARHIGRSTQVWEIENRDERERTVSLARLTMAVVASD